MSNKITLKINMRTIQARLRPWADDLDGNLYWRSRTWNGYVRPSDEGITWLRGWNLDQKVRDALVVSAALSR